MSNDERQTNFKAVLIFGPFMTAVAAFKHDRNVTVHVKTILPILEKIYKFVFYGKMQFYAIDILLPNYYSCSLSTATIE